MGFLYIRVCELLEDLQSLHTRQKPLSAKEIKIRTRCTIQHWFSKHREEIDNADGVALLSALIPRIRTDKVYSIGELRLQGIIATSDGMSESRRKDLSKFTEPGKGDLADCVERSFLGFHGPSSVTVEDVEQVTMAVASDNRFSAPLVRRSSCSSSFSSGSTHFQPLINLYRRLGKIEAKWLTRLILKEKGYLPIEMDDFTIYRSFHPRLPDVLRVRAYLADALAFLRTTENLTGPEWLKYLLPKVGIKVGRPTFYQGRSVRNCVDMLGSRPMIAERKYDGEYLQLHIDLVKHPLEWIQIFSKSGKDSTKDRAKVHDTIRECFALGKPSCEISQECILEGELLVYNDKFKKLSPFHKIRKHVSRSGTFLGTEQDSQPHDHEHLCIIFFDIMLLDGQSLLFKKHSERQKVLRRILRIIPGRAEIAQRTTVSPCPNAAEVLRRVFARSISRNEEGLVVKADDPYVTLSDDYRGDFRSCCVKMKKDAMPNLSDIQQFAVIGANYKATDARKPGLFHQSARIKYTEFFLGCLENKKDLENDVQPQFVVVATIELNGALMADLIQHDSLGVATPYSSKDHNPTDGEVFKVRVPPGVANGQPPTTIFKRPFVFAVKSFGFDMASNTAFETVRFPQVTRIHYDKNYQQDCVTFQELQKKAEAVRAVPPELVDIEKEQDWMDKLREADPTRTRAVIEIEETTQTTRGTTQRSSQGHATFIAAGSPVSKHDHAHISSHVKKPQASPPDRTPMTSAEEDTELLLSLVREILGAPPRSSNRNDNRTGPLPKTSPEEDAEESILSQVRETMGAPLSSTVNNEHAADSPPKCEQKPRPPRLTHNGLGLPRYGSSRPLASAQSGKHRLSSTKAPDYSDRLHQPRPENTKGKEFSHFPQTSKFVAGVQQENQVQETKVSSRKRRLQYPPTRFLEQIDLARAAADQIWKRCEEEFPQLPAKKRKREIFADIRNLGDIPPETISKQPDMSNTGLQASSRDIEAVSSRSNESSYSAGTLKGTDIVKPYPTPPHEQTDKNAFSDSFHNAKASDEISKDSDTMYNSPAAIAPHRSSSVSHILSSSPPPISPPKPRRQHHQTLSPSPSTSKLSSQCPICASSTKSKSPCLFARHTFLLSPCIAQNTHIHSLITTHNRSFTTSLTEWASPTLFPTHFPSDHPLFPRKRMLRCVLVESRNTEVTGKLVLDVKRWFRGYGLRKGNGEWESVVVVDWRILEKVGRLEREERGEGMGYCIWQRFRAYGGVI